MFPNEYKDMMPNNQCVLYFSPIILLWTKKTKNLLLRIIRRAETRIGKF